jgi:hypothetical protein
MLLSRAQLVRTQKSGYTAWADKGYEYQILQVELSLGCAADMSPGIEEGNVPDPCPFCAQMAAAPVHAPNLTGHTVMMIARANCQTCAMIVAMTH